MCRREVYAYVQQHDAAWLRGVEDHVLRAEALRPGTRAVAGPQAAAAAAERKAWLRGKVEASVFARWLQDIEDGCLGSAACGVLQAEGWPARSWGSRTGCWSRTRAAAGYAAAAAATRRRRGWRPRCARLILTY